MRYRFIFILCLLFSQCQDSTYKPPKYAAITMFYILNTYLPEQKAREECARPNAIGYPYHDNNLDRIACLSNKVTQGLIYDADTNIPITAETLPPGQSFLCKCPPRGGHWQRGIITEENPTPGTPLQFVLYTTTNNISLKYLENYDKPNNLYCISQCSATDLNSIQYQFLKIR